MKSNSKTSPELRIGEHRWRVRIAPDNVIVESLSPLTEAAERSIERLHPGKTVDPKWALVGYFGTINSAVSRVSADVARHVGFVGHDDARSVVDDLRMWRKCVDPIVEVEQALAGEE
jgi:hypothetical protein